MKIHKKRTIVFSLSGIAIIASLALYYNFESKDVEIAGKALKKPSQQLSCSTSSTSMKVTIQSPSENSSVKGSTGVQFSAQDSSGSKLKKMRYQVDGGIISEKTINSNANLCAQLSFPKDGSEGKHAVKIQVENEKGTQSCATVNLNYSEKNGTSSPCPLNPF